MSQRCVDEDMRSSRKRGPHIKPHQKVPAVEGAMADPEALIQVLATTRSQPRQGRHKGRTGNVVAGAESFFVSSVAWMLTCQGCSYVQVSSMPTETHAPGPEQVRWSLGSKPAM